MVLNEEACMSMSWNVGQLTWGSTYRLSTLQPERKLESVVPSMGAQKSLEVRDRYSLEVG